VYFSLNSGFINLPTNNTDVENYLRNLARLLPKAPQNSKVENLIQKLKSVYYNNTATEDGTTDVSIGHITFALVQ
jgi:hypothetical protein